MRGWLELLAMPAVLFFGVVVLLPWQALQRWFWWQSLPPAERRERRQKERVRRLQQWERMDSMIRADLAASGLTDTAENRARVRRRR